MSTKSSSQTQPTTLNIPSLILFTILSVLAIRYFFFNNSSISSTTSSSSSSNGRRIPADRIEQIAVMFPQLNRRDIEYDLSRNGANVASTTERVLREGRLPGAPASFVQQQIPSSTQPVTATSSTSSSTQRAGAGQTAAYKDLITRYGLSSKIASSETSAVEAANEEKQKKGGWSQNKTERQALLKRRREEMILEARRKLEQKDRAGAASVSGAA